MQREIIRKRGKHSRLGKGSHDKCKARPGLLLRWWGVVVHDKGEGGNSAVVGVCYGLPAWVLTLWRLGQDWENVMGLC